MDSHRAVILYPVFPGPAGSFPGRGRSRGVPRGLTLIEILIATSVILVAMIGLLSVMYYTTRLNAANRENLAALRAAEHQIETLRAAKFDEIYARYNDTPADDILNGPNPGSSFDVEGLQPLPGRQCGRILFPGDGSRLLEDVNDPAWGMPRDLNGNGLVDTDSVSGPGLALLPVTVEITWTGIQGPRTITYRHMFLRTEAAP